MMTLNSVATFRLLLALDAAVSGATGIATIAAAFFLEPLFKVPALVMGSAGAMLVPFAAMAFFFSRPAQLTPSRAWAVVALNVAWVVASVLGLVTGWIEPTTLGLALCCSRPW